MLIFFCIIKQICLAQILEIWAAAGLGPFLNLSQCLAGNKCRAFYFHCLFIVYIFLCSHAQLSLNPPAGSIKTIKHIIIVAGIKLWLKKQQQQQHLHPKQKDRVVSIINKGCNDLIYCWYQISFCHIFLPFPSFFFTLTPESHISLTTAKNICDELFQAASFFFVPSLTALER